MLCEYHFKELYIKKVKEKIFLNSIVNTYPGSLTASISFKILNLSHDNAPSKRFVKSFVNTLLGPNNLFTI